MNSVTIGVHVHAEPARMQATLAALRAHSGSASLVVLPDGPDFATAALRNVDLPQLPTCEPRGPAACFNRLAASCSSAVVVLLESGAIVSPGWLDALLAALHAAPDHGLAGPSTNRSWNEQCAFPNAHSSADAITLTARSAGARFGAQCRTLEPLFSLADFCYAVRREVIDTIGAADEGYGLGPCWEMDYNIRAHRAGFQGVWACASYVYRFPFTSRRVRHEAQLFDASRRRYQDKFCGLRLAGSSPAYEPHCRGGACEHFAPSALVELKIPLVPLAPAIPQPTPVQITALRDQPLVSCIMVTRDRPEFVARSIRYFERQDYPRRELVIIDDGCSDLAAVTPCDERIRYVRLPARESIGAKRNRACELAAGSILAHWDDDDWYAPDRLSRQVAPLLAGKAEITALHAGIFFDLAAWKFWQATPQLHRRLFVEDVHGGTLVYKRSCWNDQCRFPDTSLAEDAVFLRRAMQRGARLGRLANEGSFVYLRHVTNAWSFECGKYLDPSGWSLVGEPSFPAEDRAFYAARSTGAARSSGGAGSPAEANDRPLVSCIMPTADRRVFVPQAIACFLRQDYAHRELIVVDDGDDCVADLMPRDARIRYFRLPQRQTVGAKRNFACEQAQGDLIAHWDDDDWMAPWRLSCQAHALATAGRPAVCGLSGLYYFEPARRRAWFYSYPPRDRRWLAGNTLCYRRSLWREHQFPAVNEGEDTRFVWSMSASLLLPLPDPSFYVALIHSSNVSPKRTHDLRWQPRRIEEIQSLLGPDFAFYDSWSCDAHRKDPAPAVA